MLLLSLLCSFVNAKTLDENLEYGWIWETSPTVEICPDSELSANQVIESISYWLDRGVDVDIQGVQYVEHCDLKKRNVIQIMGDRNVPFDENARTSISWYYYGKKNKNTTFYIRATRVQLPYEASNNNTIVLHEIGHALGLEHTSNDHIMQTHH
tara:strand:- start:143 stop:604 length:462 start_codon:yes stop_codon:yes gene_type:complete